MKLRSVWLGNVVRALGVPAVLLVALLIAGCGDGGSSAGGVSAHGPGVPADLIDFVAGEK